LTGFKRKEKYCEANNMSRRIREQLKNVGWYGNMIETGHTSGGNNGMPKILGRILLVLITFLMVFHPPDSAVGQETAAITPPPGSNERKLILDALRNTMRSMHGLDMVFIVSYVRVQNNWAWIDTQPQSSDGENRYEGVSALLRKQGTRWDVAEIACAEEDNDRCIGSPDYFRLLKKRFSGLPAGILPEK
jgi:hypothetical protein